MSALSAPTFSDYKKAVKKATVHMYISSSDPDKVKKLANNLKMVGINTSTGNFGQIDLAQYFVFLITEMTMTDRINCIEELRYAQQFKAGRIIPIIYDKKMRDRSLWSDELIDIFPDPNLANFCDLSDLSHDNLSHDKDFRALVKVCSESL